jgi:2'-5' RNA ligase
VPIDDTAEITDTLTEAASGIEPFEIKIGGSGTFPPKGRPRVIWAGINEPTGRVQALFEAIDRAVEGFGIKREKKRYHPHVTIGRVKGRIGLEDIAPGLEEMNGIDFGSLMVNNFTFFMSELTRSGPIYTVLATVPLGK